MPDRDLWRRHRHTRLGHWPATVGVRARCLTCGHTGGVPVDYLVRTRQVEPGATLQDLADMLRCSRCGRTQLHLVPDLPEAPPRHPPGA